MEGRGFPTWSDYSSTHPRIGQFMGTNSKRRFRNTAVALGALLSLHAPSSGAVTRAAVTRTAVAVSERPRRLAAISTAALLQRGVVMTEID